MFVSESNAARANYLRNSFNGGLWFRIDDCIRKDVVATYQSNFWGPWWNYNMVPQEKKDAWWISFVQKYYWDPQHHSEVRSHWEEIHQNSIRDLVSKRRRSKEKKKPDFIGLADWNMMLEIWEEEPHQKRSKTNSKNATSNPDGLGTHRHTSGSKNHTCIVFDMTVEAGGVAPTLTALVLKTHSSKDGTCIDKRAEAYVKAAESLALERSQSATATGETPSAPSTQQLNSAYLEVATNTKGRVYGLGSLQYVDAEPKESPAASLSRNIGVDGRLTTEGVVTGLKEIIDLLLKMNGVDPITRQHIPRESGASAPSPHSDSSQELNQHSPTH